MKTETLIQKLYSSNISDSDYYYYYRKKKSFEQHCASDILRLLGDTVKTTIVRFLHTLNRYIFSPKLKILFD